MMDSSVFTTIRRSSWSANCPSPANKHEPPRLSSRQSESPWVSFRFILLGDGTMTNLYPAEFRERALRMLTVARHDHLSDFAAAGHVAGRLGVNPETLRLWKKRADVNTGVAPGTCRRCRRKSNGPRNRSPSWRKRTRSSGQRAYFSPPGSAAPHRDDPLHRCDEGSFRGRARLPHHAGS